MTHCATDCSSTCSVLVLMPRASGSGWKMRAERAILSGLRRRPMMLQLPSWLAAKGIDGGIHHALDVAAFGERLAQAAGVIGFQQGPGRRGHRGAPPQAPGVQRDLGEGLQNGP